VPRNERPQRIKLVILQDQKIAHPCSDRARVNSIETTATQNKPYRNKSIIDEANALGVGFMSLCHFLAASMGDVFQVDGF
jgi:hypothetical protein